MGPKVHPKTWHHALGHQTDGTEMTNVPLIIKGVRASIILYLYHGYMWYSGSCEVTMLQVPSSGHRASALSFSLTLNLTKPSDVTDYSVLVINSH